MFDKRILMNKKQMLLKKLIWAQMLGINGSDPWTIFTGNPLEFNAKKAHALRSCVVDIEPVQSGSGDPSPDNVRPISGWTGANVYLADCIPVTIVWNPDSDGKFIGASGNPGASPNFHYSEYLPVTKGKYLYHFSTTDGGTNRQTRIHGYDASKNWVRQVGYQATSSGSYSIEFVVEADISYVRISNTRLGVSNEFVEPKQLSALAVDWTDEAGTVYGGTLDVLTGVLTVDRGIVDLGTLSWSNNAADSVFSKSVPQKINSSNPIASALKKVATGTANINMPDASFKVYSNSNSVAVKLSGITSGNAQSMLDGIMYCYELATPQTYQLTPEQVNALAGRNVMWTDCESLTVEAKGTAVTLDALQSLNLLMGGRYVNNGTPDDVSDDEALSIVLGGENR